MSNIRKIEDVLQEDKIFVSTTVGVSMYPMLRNRRDTIIIEPYEGRLKKYDIPLYKRGSRYVLHRIVDVLPDSYVICGDNCIEKEYGITDEHILGVMTGCYRGKKRLNLESPVYKAYVRFWCGIFPLRRFVKRVRGKLASIVRRICKNGCSPRACEESLRDDVSPRKG